MNTHQKLQQHIDRMTPEEKAAYFRAKARKCSDRWRVFLREAQEMFNTGAEYEVLALQAEGKSVATPSEFVTGDGK